PSKLLPRQKCPTFYMKLPTKSRPQQHPSLSIKSIAPGKKSSKDSFHSTRFFRNRVTIKNDITRSKRFFLNPVSIAKDSARNMRISENVSQSWKILPVAEESSEIRVLSLSVSIFRFIGAILFQYLFFNLNYSIEISPSSLSKTIKINFQSVNSSSGKSFITRTLYIVFLIFKKYPTYNGLSFHL